MIDKNNNPVRFYKVIYTRNLHGQSRRIQCTVVGMSEWQLQQMLYDFESPYQFIVLSAEYLPNFTGNEGA